MEPDTLTLEEARYWMSALAVWLDQQEGPLRFKNDPDSYLGPKQTARVLRTLILTEGTA